MFSRNNSIDIKDFDIDVEENKKKKEEGECLCPVLDKKKKENVALNLYLRSHLIKILSNSQHFFLQPSVFNLNGIVKILGVQSPLIEKQRKELLKAFNYYNYIYINSSKEEFNSNFLASALVETEYMKYGPIKDYMQNYIKSNGKHDLINPTVRSKIIYGVAAIMKRLHKNHIVHQYLLDHIYLDDKLEPRIKLSSYSFIIEDELISDYDDIYKPMKYFSPEQISYVDSVITLKSDVFDFSTFLYAMFTGDFRPYGYYQTLLELFRSIKSGRRPKLTDVIPKHYKDLIEDCWRENPDSRPSFDEIVEIIKDDKFALNEFGMKTDLDELHEYQKRIDSDKEKVSVKKTAEKPSPKIEEKIKEYESVLQVQLHHQPETENIFFDEDDESNFTNLGEIGEGGTAVTYKLVDKRNKNPICKKVLKYKKGQKSIKDAQDVLKEFEILHSINHPCICKAYGINLSEKLEINIKGKKTEITTIALFLEYLEYGLDDVLKMSINNTMKAKIVVDIVHAMNHLHKKGMIHRDLKIENIMLNSIFETKLVDFGLVKISEYALDGYSFENESLTKGVGTFAYMSPEMANLEDYNNKTDVYSFGVVLHFMFTGSLPNQSIRDKTNGKKISLPSPSHSISKLCIKIISKCLSPSPSDRPSFEEILSDLRKNSFELADDVNPIIVARRDKELDLIEEIQKH